MNLDVQKLDGIESSGILSTPDHENNFSDLTIFPNPAPKYQKELYTNLTQDQADFIIYDITGKTIQSGQINSTQPINIEQLSSGMFMIHLQSGSNQSTQHFIKL